MKTPLMAACALSVLVLAASQNAQADTISVLVADLPPMSSTAKEGREIDIINEVFGRCGHTADYVVQPFTRHWQSYQQGKGDAVATVPPGMPMEGHATSVYIEFQNGVSYLAGSGTSIASLSDLAGKHVIAFRGAQDILPGLKDATGSFADYREVTDQIVQSRSLFAGRTDAVIGDGMIFAEYNRQLTENADSLNFDPTQPVEFKKTFDPSGYTMVFRNPAHSADFERCFAEAKADGTIDKINTEWTEKYRAVLGSDYLGY